MNVKNVFSFVTNYRSAMVLSGIYAYYIAGNKNLSS